MLVTGTYNPKNPQTANALVDVTGVQTAVDSGESEIQLAGNFFFGDRTVMVTKPIRIVGVRALRTQPITPGITGGGGVIGGMPAGAFTVNVPDKSVTIQNVSFISPTMFAIRVPAVRDLTISQCRIEKVKPIQAPGSTFEGATGIVVGTPDPNVIPRKTLGSLKITDNDIDIGGVASQRTLGILINYGGIAPDVLAMPEITNNTVRNVTAFGISLVDLLGKATIQGNVIEMGTVGNKDVTVAGIRCSGRGIYAITRGNVIRCGFEKAAGIRLQETNEVPHSGSTLDTIVDSNEITMSRPGHATADNANAGIELSGIVHGKTVSNNKISGAAGAALSLLPITDRFPTGNLLESNRHPRATFTSLVADIVVGDGVTGTQITAPDEFLTTKGGQAGTIFDGGLGTTNINGDYSIVG